MKLPMIRTSLLSVLTFLCISSRISAEDWPEFRGSTGQGHAEGKLPVSWGAETNVAWSVEVPGKGWSSPVVVRESIYLTTATKSADGKELALRCLSLSAVDGKTQWDVEVFKHPTSSAPNIHSKNSHASPTALVRNQRIYVHFGHHGTACLDLQGKILWRTNEHAYRPVHGNGGSPCLVDEVLIICCDGEDKQAVIGLNAVDGQTKWKTDRKTKPSRPFSFGTPLAISVKGAKQVICPGSDVVMALDPSDGKELWRVRYTGYSQVPRPLFGHDMIYLCTGFDTPQLLAIRVDGHGELNRNVPHTSSPIIAGDAIYMVADNGVISCVDAIKGDYRWQGRLAGPFSASLLIADGSIYCLNEQGVCHIVQAGPKFQESGKSTLPGQTLASPAASRGSLFIRTDSKLFCIRSFAGK